MIVIIHENLEREAETVAETLRKNLGIESMMLNEKAGELFTRIAKPGFSGECYGLSKEGIMNLKKSLGERPVMIITPRDLYGKDKSQKDDWVLRSNYGLINFASVARLRGKDGNPSKKIEVPLEKYFRRLNTLALHEVGHHVVQRNSASHMKMAFWVPVIGEQFELGFHCTDNRCLMYEIVDVKTPPREEGCMILRNLDGSNSEARYDAGLDECIDRQYEGLFCDKCKKAVKVGDVYK